MDQPATAFSLLAPLAEVPGIGPTRLKALERLDLHTVGDLLTHYPRRYEDRRHFEQFPDGSNDQPVCVCGIVVSTASKRLGGKRQMFEVTLQEVERHALSSLLTIRWFNTWYVQKIFAHGQRVVVYGKPRRRARGSSSTTRSSRSSKTTPTGKTSSTSNASRPFTRRPRVWDSVPCAD